MTPFVLNKPAILERLGGDEEIFAIMVDMFLQDAENNCAMMESALNEGSAALQREVHTVKGLLATLSDETGAEFAQSLEVRLKQGDLQDAAAEVGVLQNRVREVLLVLRHQSAG